MWSSSSLLGSHPAGYCCHQWIISVEEPCSSESLVTPKRMTSFWFQCVVTAGRLREDLKVLGWHQTGKLSSDWASEPHILRLHEDVTGMQMALSI